MNKRFLLALGLLLVVGGATWLAINWYNEREATRPAFSERELSKAIARLHPNSPAEPAVAAPKPLLPSQNVRLAIGSLGLPDDSQNRQLGDLLTAELSGTKGLELVERQSLDRVLGELQLNLSGLVRARDAVRVGKLLRAEWFLLGTTAPAGAGKAVVARIVDAQTGIMRDVGVFTDDGARAGLATKLAQFVRDCRQAGSASKPRLFLAVGTFRDLSVNNRLAEFPTQLRARLIQAYQGSGVTLLEREHVDALLQEVRLDLAGLTETSGAPAPRMQSAFWLVDGYYQSYETSDHEVELGLNIKRIFGRQQRVLLREKPGEPLVKRVRAEIDKALAAGTPLVAPTRFSEARAQMEAGKELCLPKIPGLGQMRPQEFLMSPWVDAADDRQRRNLEEAMRAFQTVLLFEPTNREAKLYVAALLRSPPLYREDEARQYYREVLDEPINDRWVFVAQQGLEASLRLAGPEERARWLQPAALQGTNPSAQFFQRESRRAAVDAALQRGDDPKRHELAEERLFDTIAQFNSGRVYQEEIGMGDFMDAVGGDRAAAARRLVELYPKMRAQASNAAPYLLASVVAHQVDTNAAVIGEFEQALEEWAAHPETVRKMVTPFWSHVDVVYRWAEEHKLAALSAKVLEAKSRATGRRIADEPVAGDEHKLRLAFAAKAAGRWQEALQVFESYSNHPVRMGNSGPWGPAFTVLLTSRETAECRKQLGLPPVQDPREFDLGKPLLCVHGDRYARQYEWTYGKVGTFAADEGGLWLAFAGRLLRLGFDLKTNQVIALPINATTPITCVCPTGSKIWIGTHGEGLLECDTASHQCTHLTEKEGLLMDFISSMQPMGDTLWIGYGNQKDGGLGKLDLRTRRFTSFMPSLEGNQGGGISPPRVPVQAVIAGVEDDVWLVAQNALLRYRSPADQWEALPDFGHTSTLGRCGDHLYVAMGSAGRSRSGEPASIGLRTLSLKDGQWKPFPVVPSLPTGVTSIAVDGANVWIGGEAYLALVDPAQDKVLKYAYVSARSVDQIELGGGWLWAQCEKHLYKASLSALR